MISPRSIARDKPQIDKIPLTDADLTYDHASQQKRQDVDRETFRIYMKSSTRFDGESDPGSGDDA